MGLVEKGMGGWVTRKLAVKELIGPYDARPLTG